MRITSKGQVTIPIDIREKAGLRPGTEVEFEYDGTTVRIVAAKEPKTRQTRGERVVAHLKKFSGSIQMTTEEIMALTRGED